MPEESGLSVKPAGVTVLESAVSSIDSSGLRYRGIAIEELVAHASYEEVAWLLWTGRAPSPDEHRALLADIAQGSDLPAVVLESFDRLPPDSAPAARLQAILPLLPLIQPDLYANREIPGTRCAALLLGAFVTLSGRCCQTNPRQLIGPAAGGPAEAGVATRFLSLARGTAVSPEDARAFEQVLILYADHELNASTFTGRVAASTHADLVSCVLAALCALRGPLHGGVDRYVRALLAAAEHEGAESVIDRYVRAGSLLPGFGHSVYRGTDPRALLMRDLARRLAPARGLAELLSLTEAVEAAAAQRGLPSNVDLYSVVVYRALAIPDQASTLVFASGRLSGWTAHILEQYANNRLIRPRAAYIGSGPRHWPPA